MFFTSGSIESKDYYQKQDYKLQALFREVKEEFRDNIKIKEYVYLNEVFAEQVKIVFYVYLITDWQGEMPDYTFEDGANDSLITWEDLSEYKRLFVYDTAYKICEDIKGYLDKGDNYEKSISNK
ncbi:hypothetical protein IMX26_12445 [Clostridium sp. 'deep sea']|uniref:hypothetical protein n=1 Tax=Clostridium sp. 'deep sea' TaxID=2779445 RepID=UPI00189670B0|nr:hypothetical protein [Clostridium sp. 'deep sea']QOR34294.1 hypothetical protein IMX26_12445 [Clostridium sp. 'deep sea']